jgi:hypothetical protein
MAVTIALSSQAVRLKRGLLLRWLRRRYIVLPGEAA